MSWQHVLLLWLILGFIGTGIYSYGSSFFVTVTDDDKLIRGYWNTRKRIERLLGLILCLIAGPITLVVAWVTCPVRRKGFDLYFLYSIFAIRRG